MARTAKHSHGRGILRRLRGDRRGVGAIEFAFVAPILIVLYIGSVEMSVAMSVNKKLGRATATVADLLTQSGSVTREQLSTMVDVAKGIMAPYNDEPIKLAVTGIDIANNGAATVAWSWRPNGGNGEAAYEQGATVDIPQNLRVPNTFLVRSEIDYHHSMITSFPITGKAMAGIDMGKAYHFRPRVNDSVNCSNCSK